MQERQSLTKYNTNKKTTNRLGATDSAMKAKASAVIECLSSTLFWRTWNIPVYFEVITRRYTLTRTSLVLETLYQYVKQGICQPLQHRGTGHVVFLTSNFARPQNFRKWRKGSCSSDICVIKIDRNASVLRKKANLKSYHNLKRNRV